MITGVGVVTVLVTDQAAAAEFFTATLGFKVATDMTMGGKRWLSVVAQPGQGPELTLFDPRSWMPADAAEQMLGLIGKLPGLVLHTDDCRKTIASLQAQGVKILREPADYPYGVEAVFADPFGNAYVLLQPAKR